MLTQAVEKVKSCRPAIESAPVTLDLPLTALIPADYVADTELRLATYRRVAAVASPRELAEVRLELEDRFGPMPEQVEHLLALIAVRLRCAELGIESVVEREREIVIRPVPTAGLEPRLRRKLGRAVRLTPNSIRVRLQDLTIAWREALDAVLDAVETTRSRATGAADAAR